MKHIKIRVLKRNYASFRDVTVGKVYAAFVLDPYENVPEAYWGYPGQRNDDTASLCFRDDEEYPCACGYDATVNECFEIVE
uniref:Uncharacterized protein n=1 Tax=Klebsiella phage FKP3 TaxID=3231233 RepID=A0AAU8HZZ4_9CAUD